MRIAVAQLFVLLFAVVAWGQTTPTSPSPVFVELFTSEGCSSCPPADALLTQLEKQGQIDGRPIIVLGEHVDYWNNLGWRDRFSSARFSERQSEYARKFGLDSVYTPQMVVNGRTEFVGNDPAALQKALSTEKRSTETVSVEVSCEHDAHITVRNSSRGARVFLAITETNLMTSVRSGENRNRELHHAGVVRQLRDLGPANGNFSVTVPIAIDRSWKLANIRVVAFTQNGVGGAIEGAASAALP